MEFYRVLHDFVVAIQPGSPQRTFYAHADAVDTWVEIRGYGYWDDEGVLRGRWIWTEPDPKVHLQKSEGGSLVDTSAMPTELPVLTVDQLNLRVSRPFLCKHRTGRWLLYDPIQANPANRAAAAQRYYGLPIEEANGDASVSFRRKTRRRTAGRVLYQQNTRRTRLVRI